MRVQGLYVPLLTPFAADGSLDAAAVRPHVDRLLDGGVEGFVALGTTGEFADLTAAERAAVVEATIAAVDGRAPVLVGVGAVGTAAACGHARHAREAGAAGVLTLPPLYWKLGDAGLVRHFAAVAEAAGIPTLLYDYPALSGTPLSPALVDKVARQVPAVVGIKQSGPALRTVHGVLSRVRQHRPEFAVMVGAAELLAPAMAAGADGGIIALGNLAPRPLAELVAALRDGDLPAAAACHTEVLRLLAIPALSSPSILALKVAAAVAGSPMEPVVRTRPEDPDRVITEAADLAGRLLTPAGRAPAAAGS